MQAVDPHQRPEVSHKVAGPEFDVDMLSKTFCLKSFFIFEMNISIAVEISFFFFFYACRFLIIPRATYAASILATHAASLALRSKHINWDTFLS